MTYSRILKAQHAINLLAYQLSVSRMAMNNIPDLQHGKDELDGVLTHIADNLESILDKTAGPVWGELTDETRAVCRQAGMANEAI